MTTLKTTLSILLAAGTLSACVGGGGGGDTDPGVTPGVPTDDGTRTFEERVAAGAALADRLEAQGLTDVADMPTSGTATYVGAAGIVTDASRKGIDTTNITEANVEVIGDLEMTADFASSSVSGQIDNFEGADGARFPGAAIISGGVISGNTLEADLGGSVNVYGTDETFTGTMRGDFTGAAADGVVGNMDGVLYGDEAGPSDFVGVFGGER